MTKVELKDVSTVKESFAYALTDGPVHGPTVDSTSRRIHGREDVDTVKKRCQEPFSMTATGAVPMRMLALCVSQRRPAGIRHNATIRQVTGS